MIKFLRRLFHGKRRRNPDDEHEYEPMVVSSGSHVSRPEAEVLVAMARGVGRFYDKDVNRVLSLESKDYVFQNAFYPDGSIKAELTGRGVAWLARHRSEALQRRASPNSPVGRALAPLQKAFLEEQELDHRFVHDPEFRPSVSTKPTGTLPAVAEHFGKGRTDYMRISRAALREAQLKGLPTPVARYTMREIAREYRRIRDYDPRRANPRKSSEPEASLDEFAQALGVTAADERQRRIAVGNRLIALDMAKVCERCGGGGRYSYRPDIGDKCLGCMGSGYVMPPLTKPLLMKAERAVKAGALQPYLENLRIRAIAANADKRIMNAWQATGIGKMYDWRSREPRDVELQAINAEMNAAYDKVHKASIELLMAKRKSTAERDVIAKRVADALEEGLVAIERAERKLEPYRQQQNPRRFRNPVEFDRFGRGIQKGDKVKVLLPPAKAAASGRVVNIEPGSRPGTAKITYAFPYFDKERTATVPAYHVLVIDERAEQQRKEGRLATRLEEQFGGLKLSKRARQTFGKLKYGALNYPSEAERPGMMELVAYGLVEQGEDEQGYEAFEMTGLGHEYDTWLTMRADVRM